MQPPARKRCRRDKVQMALAKGDREHAINLVFPRKCRSEALGGTRGKLRQLTNADPVPQMTVRDSVLMRVRPIAAPTLATHLCHTFPEHIRTFVCLVDHANSHSSDRGLVLQECY